MYQRKLGTMKERKVHNHYVVVLVPYSQCNVIMTIAWGAEIIFCSPGYCHGWRWRELNSRPTIKVKAFYGCSLLIVVFGSSVLANRPLTNLAA